MPSFSLRSRTTLVSLGVIAFAAAAAVTLTGASRDAFSAPETSHANAHIAKLLGRMTLEEKVGQMTQLSLDMFAAKTSDGEVDPDPDHLDMALLQEAIEVHHVGSIFNTIRHALHPAQWHRLLARIDALTKAHSRLHIPVLFGIDAVHGATYTRGATIFAHAIGQAATFDRALVGQAAAITAKDVQASHIPWNFAPVLDVARQPLWPRTYETFGEDTFVVSELGRATMAQHTGSLPCLKHYVGYSAPASGRDRTPAILGERATRQIFLPPFAAAIAAGAPSVMLNSGSVDGVPGHANAFLLQDVLRHELHFDGVTVSDYRDVERLHTRDRVAHSPKEAVRMAVLAGVDMSMVPDNFLFGAHLIELVREGSVPMARIDQAVRRILRLKAKAGLLAEPSPRDAIAAVGTADDHAVNLTLARDSMTLLKNDDQILPLKVGSRILLAGPNADDLQALAGGWTYTWQGDDPDYRAPHHAKDAPTVRTALGALVGDDHVVFAKTVAEAVAHAHDVDVAVLCLGEGPYAETPGNIDDLTLPADQLALAQALQAAHVPTVLVLIEGRPRIVRPIVDQAKAVLMAYLPGLTGGQAIAETLLGHNNPSGRLPLTYPRAVNALLTYDYLPAEVHDSMRYDPEWPFGAGLSYTTFAYSDLAITPNKIAIGQPVKVAVTVRNTGTVAGKHSVLLYLSDHFASISRPARELHGFAKVSLAPGASEQVHFELTPHDLSFIGLTNKRIVEPGSFSVAIDALHADFHVTGKAPLQID